MEKNSVVKPIHIAIGVGVIVAAMIGVPLFSAAYNRAYPEYGTVERFLVDECAKQQGEMVRWNAEALAMCKVGNRLHRRYGS
jgi:hypothetical protein